MTDTTDTTTLTLSAASSVAEGSGTLTYTATLSNAAQGAVTVNLDDGRTITIADGATQGTLTVAVRADDPYLDPSTLSGDRSSTASGGNFEDAVDRHGDAYDDGDRHDGHDDADLECGLERGRGQRDADLHGDAVERGAGRGDGEPG